MVYSCQDKMSLKFLPKMLCYRANWFKNGKKKMIVFNGIENIIDDFRETFVTVGNFDGVHLSHQFICRKLAKEARNADRKSLVITFDPHPKMILHPDIRPFYLVTTLEERLELLEKCSIDGVVVIPFTLGYSRTTAEQFVRRDLIQKIAIKKIIVGHDYTFGQDRNGTSDYLISAGREMGFEVEVVDAFKVGQDVVSSTLIRNLILRGDLKKVTDLLGRWYNTKGTVVKGHGRGVGLGFPTANLKPEKELLPGPGIYAAYAFWKGNRYLAAVNIGTKPTFADYVFTFEAFLLDFTGNLLGEKINIYFVEKLRDIIKFDSPEKLKKQIAADVKEIRKMLLQSNKTS
jgi:riboflavin kinase / FMN adenylyltransferase